MGKIFKFKRGNRIAFKWGSSDIAMEKAPMGKISTAIMDRNVTATAAIRFYA